MADVFISYSRHDSGFVRRLHGELAARNRDTWIDWEDIPPTAEWMREISAAIENADNFVFVISPESVHSVTCRRELEHAAAQNKRLIPIVRREAPDAEIPPSLASLNWIYFRDSDPFDSRAETLLEALDTNLEWVRRHTRLLARSLEWERGKKDDSLLLRGTDLSSAEQALVIGATADPKPTTLMAEFVLASRQSATRRQRRVVAVSIGAALLMAILAVFAWQQRSAARRNETLALDNAQRALRNEKLASEQRDLAQKNERLANENADEARRQTQIAEERRREAERQARIALGRQVAAQAVTMANTEDADLGLLLGVQGSLISDTVEAKSSLLSGLVENRFLKKYLHAHEAETPRAAFSPAGNLFATVGCVLPGAFEICEAYGIRLWDAGGLKPLADIRLPDRVAPAGFAFSGDGKLLAVISVSKIRLWDVGARRLVREITMTGAGGSLAFHPREPLLAAANSRGLEVYDPRSGKRLAMIPSVATRVAFSPDGRWMGVGGTKGQLSLRKATELTSGGGAIPLRGHEDDIIDLAFSPDSHRLASASYRRVMVWDAEVGKAIHTLADGRSVHGVGFSSDGKRLAASLRVAEEGGEISLMDAATGRQIATLKGRGQLSFHPQRQLLVSGGPRGSAIIWDLEQEHRLRKRWKAPGEVLSLAFRPDGRAIATGGRDGRIQLFDAASGKPLVSPFKAHDRDVHDLCFDPRGELLASAGQDQLVMVWRVQGSAVAPLHRLTGHTGPVSSLAFSRSGQVLASGGFDNRIFLWDPGTGKQRQPPIEAPDEVYALDFSPDERRLAAGTEDGSVLIWTLGGVRPSARLLGAHAMQSDGMSAVSFRPDGRVLASSSLENTILWDTATGQRIGDAISGGFGAFTADGRSLALADFDTVFLADAAAGRRYIQALGAHDDYVSALAVSPDGQRVATASGDEVSLWDIDPEAWRRTSCEAANRALTREEWSRILGALPYDPACGEAPSAPSEPTDAFTAFVMAERHARREERSAAVRMFARAAEFARAETDAKLSNEICWQGAVHGAGREVRPACQRAVELEPDNAGYRDSRGVALASSGQFSEAVRDFEAFVAAARTAPHKIERRREWIRELRAGRNPFDAVLLRTLRNEGFDFR